MLSLTSKFIEFEKKKKAKKQSEFDDLLEDIDEKILISYPSKKQLSIKEKEEELKTTQKFLVS